MCVHHRPAGPPGQRPLSAVRANARSALQQLALLAASREQGIPVVDGGVYAATQGPRLETAAEINRLERDGATVVGMTGMPEAALAREAGLPYAALCAVANWAAGRGDSAHAISFEPIEATLQKAMGKVRTLIAHLCAA